MFKLIFFPLIPFLDELQAKSVALLFCLKAEIGIWKLSSLSDLWQRVSFNFRVLYKNSTEVRFKEL